MIYTDFEYKNHSICKRLQTILFDYKCFSTDLLINIIAYLQYQIIVQLFKNLEIMRNRVSLIGNVGNAPEIKKINNTNFAQFSLATKDTYTNAQGEKVEDTEWHKIVAWGKLAEIIEKYVTKGKQIAIEGKITYRHYDDANGNKRYVTEILAHNLLLL